MVHNVYSLSCLIFILCIFASINLLSTSLSLHLPFAHQSVHPPAKPQNSASIVTVEAGTSQVVVARCDSVEGRPASQIKWVTTATGNDTMVSKINADNTVTINSEYRLVPKPEDNGKDISCVVAHRTLNKPDSFPLKLAVQCKKTHTHWGLTINSLAAHTVNFYSLLFLSPFYLSTVADRCPSGDNSGLWQQLVLGSYKRGTYLPGYCKPRPNPCYLEAVSIDSTFILSLLLPLY